MSANVSRVIAAGTLVCPPYQLRNCRRFAWHRNLRVLEDDDDDSSCER